MICGVWSGVMVACGHTFLYLTPGFVPPLVRDLASVGHTGDVWSPQEPFIGWANPGNTCLAGKEAFLSELLDQASVPVVVDLPQSLLEDQSCRVIIPCPPVDVLHQSPQAVASGLFKVVPGLEGSLDRDKVLVTPGVKLLQHLDGPFLAIGGAELIRCVPVVPFRDVAESLSGSL